MRPLGINTWVWTSPLTDPDLPPLLDHVAGLGYDLVELPLENPDDLDGARSAAALADAGLRASVVGAMSPGRDLVATDAATVRRTQDYLRACLDLAAEVGSPTVCGPFYAATGRTFATTPEERRRIEDELVAALTPVLEHARAVDVRLGIEPLNRYETSILTTVDQALTALAPLLSPHLGLALDTYHLGIEERDVNAAVRRAGRHVVHVQVCGNDRGAPGGDRTDWPGLIDALDDVGYGGPLVVESFTAQNQALARAASIWRPLAPTQDDLARDAITFLRTLTADTHPTGPTTSPVTGEPAGTTPRAGVTR